MLMGRCTPRGFKVEMTDCFLYKSLICDPFKTFIRSLFKINNEIIGPFFVTAHSSLPVKRNQLRKLLCLLAYILLIYNKLLSYECTWVLENNLFLFHLYYIMFIHVKVLGTWFSAYI